MRLRSIWLFLVMALLAVVALTACVSNKKYVCPMHRVVQADQPGKCPKCGMELRPEEIVQPDERPRYDNPSGSSHHAH